MFIMLLISAQAVYAANNASNYEPKSGPYKGKNGELMTGDDPLTSIKMGFPEKKELVCIYEILFGVDKVSNDAVTGVSYDPATNTLSLNNFRRPDVSLYASMMGDDFTVKVTGSCELEQIEVSTLNYWEMIAGKQLNFPWGGSLNITGTGTLTVNKTKKQPWGITLWAEGADARLNISKHVSLNVYGDGLYNSETGKWDLEKTAIEVVRSASFYDNQIIFVDSKPIQQAYPKYAMTGFMNESDPKFKDYWVKAEEVLIRGTGPENVGGSPVDLSAESFTYNGKVQKPEIQKIGGSTVKEGTDYEVKWSDASSKNAGTYTLTITGKGEYTGSKKMTYKIGKAKNPLAVKGRTAAVKYAKLKNKTQQLSVSKVMKFSAKGKGKMSYVKTSGNKKITINKKNGKVTVGKGLKKGTYKVKVKVKAAGNANYKASAAKTVTFKIKIG